MKLTLGSLFDGSGGFPLAGYLTGITPLWASEVEPYPIAVTRSRFPAMKHLGSVTDINGGEIEPVDIITFGSPCQDLSVAGKRAGLKHEVNGDEETTRSGLFVEAVRIIREMREATNGRYPTFALWENVPGAFSSNRGEDFRTVLTELIGIVEPNAVMPPVPKGGWAYADSYTGDGWSLAYRVFDAQHWGVPQRRRRIHLVLDLRGQRAREVLFEREGVRWYFEACGAQGKGAAEDAQGSPAADDRTGDRVSEKSHPGGIAAVVAAPYAFHLQQDPIGGPVSPCIGGQHQATVGVIFQPVPGVLLDDQGGQQINIRTDEKSPTLRAETHGNLPCVVEAAAVEVKPVYCLQGNGIDRADTAGCNGKGWKEDVCYTLNTIDRSAVAHLASGKETVGTLMANAGTKLWLGNQEAFSGDYHIVEETPPSDQYIVRRLTPTECARLQGFPDEWGHPDHKDSFTTEEYHFWLNVRNTHAVINGKQVKDYTEAQMLPWYNKLHTDSAEYKMWGNGIALPPALYVMQGIAKTLRKQWLDDLLRVVDS